jgi:glutamyl-tRNA reductase
MQLNLVGINHQTAPLSIREKIAISSEKLTDSLALLHSHVPQGIILSTCNRTEIYTVANNGEDTEKAGLDFFKVALAIPGIDLLKYVYTSSNTDAARHIFRVASGLESMIVGEFEVLGQVRQALEVAEKGGMVDLPLRQAFQSAIRTGRMVREQTGISKNALSVSSVAVELANEIAGDLKTCRMLVIGAGEAGRLVAEVALKKGISQIVIASRTIAKAQALAASLGGIAIGLKELDSELNKANIVVTCAGAPHRVLSYQRIENVMKTRPEVPLIVIDIAIPRNVAPEVNEIKNVFIYNIDDLNGIAELNRKQREKEIQHAEQIINNEVGKFDSWWHELEIRPLVGALMSRAEEIRLAQLNKTLKRLPPLSDDQQENLEAMTKSIVTQILKDPIQYLKTNGNCQVRLVEELFNLKEANPQ